jgi:predicted N-formylglutamate amidohydrolase
MTIYFEFHVYLYLMQIQTYSAFLFELRNDLLEDVQWRKEIAQKIVKVLSHPSVIRYCTHVI